jgi:hypothetical protein
MAISKPQDPLQLIMMGRRLAMNSSFHPPLATSHKQNADKATGLMIMQPTRRQVMMFFFALFHLICLFTEKKLPFSGF